MSDPFATWPPVQKDAAPARADASPHPERIGRYRVERVLGKGSFGLVYLAHDEQLSRLVAIKVPHARLVAQAADAEAYLTEARTVANLDHPHIVPVFDVGSTDQFPCFAVSKYIDGTDLATKQKQSPVSLHEAVDLVATVAEALHHAHKQGLVHRDIKPGNLLLNKGGQPFVADFGLALREQDIGKGPRYAGTPAYMSPEQARGEGHRVDGRSDIFSLGVVFYELMTGRRPFRGDNQAELFEQITSVEVRPPRMIDDRVPKELDRICLKALSKRASDRYSTARDMAEDLRHFLGAASEEKKAGVTGQQGDDTAPVTPVPSAVATSSDQQAVKIVPKGLRAFDARDADFFLQLLPGPRNRDGLPESIQFWKTHIETTEADATFSVGLIYGPSGCGKSSLVKAGLLPRVAKSVTAVYVEATADETESRLLKSLRRQVPDLPSNIDLVQALAALRQGQFLASGQKVLLVLDQFEQWLHANRSKEDTELVQALRQCNGGRLQCIVMVRDDFWLAVSRFMQALEIRVVEAHNSRLVDLFDVLHARKVLSAYGRAYDRLPDNLAQCSTDQEAFLDQAVAGLAQDGKVISVRLALFAEMVKGKPWTPATLKEVGGTEGVGVTFLEESFTASTAPPQHRLHQKAAQAVLNAMLSEARSDIKGHMRSQQELLEASGYASRPKDFDDLLRILDGEIRLITPTDPEGKADADPSACQSGVKYYQLTHDYLVPSLRDWLTRKQKETRRGRAELLLADRAAVWNARPENRQLPSLLQWLQIRALTQKKYWTAPQRKMMRRARRYNLVRSGIVAVLLAGAAVVALSIRNGVVAHNNQTRALALVKQVLNEDIAKVPDTIDEMAGYRRWADNALRQAYDDAEESHDAARQLRASLALLPVDRGQVSYLYDRLLDAEPEEILVIGAALARYKDRLLDKLWAVAQQPPKDGERLRAAAALAIYDRDNGAWAGVAWPLAEDLVRVHALKLASWMNALRPISDKLLTPLSDIFRNPKHRETERSLATDVLANFAAGQPELLADLVQDADGTQFAVLFRRLDAHRERALSLLGATVDTKLESMPSELDKEKLARRQANAAVAMLLMGQSDKVWPLLKHSVDPRTRSYLIHALQPLGAQAAAPFMRLCEEQEVSIRRALLLSLGHYKWELLPAADREAYLAKVWQFYEDDADGGIHGAAEWLLRQWGQEEKLKQSQRRWANDAQKRADRVQEIKTALSRKSSGTAPRALSYWYLNSAGQTMVVIPATEGFDMGSPTTEEGRFDGPTGTRERQHKVRIARSFVIAAKAVTVADFTDPDFQKFHKANLGYDYDWFEQYAPSKQCPANAVSWYEAAAFCNWLSDKEKLERCYEPNSKGRYAEGMKPVPDYLHKSGYRLPTEAEWEYACRAHAQTARFYGETARLLKWYGVYLGNSDNGKGGNWTSPVASLKPNDFGLFDMYGNVWCWCEQAFAEYVEGKDGKPVDDGEDGESLMVTNGASRVLRGGSFERQPVFVRSAFRFDFAPASRSYFIGWRPARTLTP